MLLPLVSNAQEYFFDLQTINVEQGLPNRAVYNIVQGKEGFIWTSSLGNISRFDGHEFVNYNAEVLNIGKDKILQLGIDKDNLLWYCELYTGKSYQKAGILDHKNDTIYDIETFSNGLIKMNSIVFIKNSKYRTSDVLIGTRSGDVFSYNGHFKKISDGHQWEVAIDIIQTSKDTLWVSNNRELRLIVNNKIIKKFHFRIAINSINKIGDGLFIRFMYVSGNKVPNLWIWNGTSFSPPKLQGISSFTGIYSWSSAYKCFSSRKNILTVQDSKGKILFRFNDFERLGINNVFSHNSFLIDKQNNIWITTSNGIVKLAIQKSFFTVLQQGNSFRGITRLDSLFFTSSYSKTFYKNLNTGLDTYFHHDYVPVIGYAKDEKGMIWMGISEGKILTFNIKTNDLKIKQHKDFHLLPFHNSSTQHLLFGTNKGIRLFDKKQHIFSKFLLKIPKREFHVRQFYENKKGIWIVTNKGLYLMNKQTEKIITHYSKKTGLPYDDLNHLHEDKKGIFWLGTKGQGLIRWDLKQNTFKQFLKEDGLSNENIYAVYRDDFNHLWLSSDYGLMQFDKKKEEVKVFLPNNGIAHEEFNTYSHFQDTDGTLYFGGINGITKFHPKDFITQKENRRIFKITKYSVLEKEAEFFKEKKFNFTNKEQLVFHHSDRVWKLHLAFLDFTDPKNNQYAYKIDDEKSHWIYSNSNVLTFNAFKPGKYTLLLKAKGISGSNSKILRISIYVTPPFYQTWWFWITTTVIISFSIWQYFQYYTRKLKRRAAYLETVVEERTQKIQTDKEIIEEQAEQLLVLDEAKSRFFSNITHEFRTPLTLIIGPLEQFISKRKSLKNNQELSMVIQNAKQLQLLINQLLDISKLESNKMLIETKRGDLISYTHELTKQFQPLTEEKEIAIIFRSSSNKCMIHFDQDKWNKIIYNLLSNAVKFTAKGGLIQVNLEMYQKDNQSFIHLLVQDTGIGIEKKNLPNIFNRFYQIDNSSTRTAEGTGIGLALVKELVEVQNGTITVMSEIGKGTSFEVYLPILTSPIQSNLNPTENKIEHLKTDKLPIIPPIEKEKNLPILELNEALLEILIIEDNADMRTYIKSCIQHLNYKILEAEDGQEGIEKAQKYMPDLIISDVMMPRKDGFEVTSAIRQDVRTSHIPIVLLTAKAALESRLEGFQRGADAYLSKPFSPQELLVRIQKLIELRQMMQQYFQKGTLKTTEKELETPVLQQENEFLSKVERLIIDNLHNKDLRCGGFCKTFIYEPRTFF